MNRLFRLSLFQILSLAAIGCSNTKNQPMVGYTDLISSTGRQSGEQGGRFLKLLRTSEDVEIKNIRLTVSGDTEAKPCADYFTVSSANTKLAPAERIAISGTAPECFASVIPQENLSGNAEINFVFTDNKKNTRKLNFNLEVLSVNDTPAISPVADVKTAEDEDISNIPIVISDPDGPLDCATALMAESDTPALVSAQRIYFSGTYPNCLMNIKPSADQSGTAHVNLSVTDEVASSQTSFKIDIDPVNDAPVFLTVPPQQIAENNTLRDVPVTVSDSDSKLECATAVSAKADKPELVRSEAFVFSGTFPNCKLSLTPVTHQFGKTVVTLTAGDGQSQVQTSFTLTVSGENSKPVLAPPAEQTINEDQISNPVSLLISDADGPVRQCTENYLRYTSSNSAIVAAAGAVTWSGTWPLCAAVVRPVQDASGNVILSFFASDGPAESSPAQFKLSVLPINDLPVISALQAQSVDEDKSLTLAVKVTDVDHTALPCNATTMTLVSSVSALLPVENAGWSGSWPNCSLTLNPSPDMNGETLVSVSANDGSGVSSPQSFKFTVTPVNDAPTIAAIPNQFSYPSVEGDTLSLFKSMPLRDTDDSLNCATALTASSSNPALLPVSSIRFGGSFPDCTMAAVPVPFQTGVTRLTVSASDTQASSVMQFDYTVRGKVVAGEGRACALSRDGQVGCWASGKIDLLSKVKGATDIYGSYQHWCALTGAGVMKCWGSNRDLQVGLSDPNAFFVYPDLTPNTVAGLASTVVRGSVGPLSSCAVIADGRMQCWGMGYSVQDTANKAFYMPRFMSEKAGSADAAQLKGVSRSASSLMSSCAIFQSGSFSSIRCWGSDLNSADPHGVFTVENLVSPSLLDAGQFHFCALEATGVVLCWGANGSGQLGDGTTRHVFYSSGEQRYVQVKGLPEAVSVSAGMNHSCALIRDGSVYCWGNNTYGQVNGKPVAGSIMTAVKVDGVSDVVSVEAGHNYSCAMTKKGIVKCWGNGADSSKSATPADVPLVFADPELTFVPAGGAAAK
jgi:hypothetical protein